MGDTIVRQSAGHHRRSRAIKGLILILVPGILGSFLAIGVSQARNAARASQTTCQLKQIGLALHNYHATYDCFPPAYVTDREGNPAHSWRVLILPFIEQASLYNAYNFAEPWNGPNNRTLETKAGTFFLRSGLDSDLIRSTSFVAVVGPEAGWKGARSVSLDELGERENTILVVEVPDGNYDWMEPRDLDFDQMSFRINDGSGRGLGSRLGGARVLMADGSVRNLPDDFDPAKLKALLTAKRVEPIKKSPKPASTP